MIQYLFSHNVEDTCVTNIAWYAQRMHIYHSYMCILWMYTHILCTCVCMLMFVHWNWHTRLCLYCFSAIAHDLGKTHRRALLWLCPGSLGQHRRAKHHELRDSNSPKVGVTSLSINQALRHRKISDPLVLTMMDYCEPWLAVVVPSFISFKHFSFSLLFPNDWLVD